MSDRSSAITRRSLLGTAAAIAATPALAEECRVGPPPHEKGPRVWMDMDQVELDASYDQSVYAPMIAQFSKRYASISETTRQRLGAPKRFAYGPTPIEGLDVYPARTANAPIFVYVHGGRWVLGSAKDYGYPADLFVNAGVNYVALDFIQVDAANGDLRAMADQVRRGIAWVYKNAGLFNGDTKRFYVGGHSSGGHLAGVAAVTDWQKDFGLPADMLSGALLMSGMYDLKPARLSARSNYVKFDDDMEQRLSSIRHIDLLRAPITVTYGSFETPDFQRQSRDFAAAVKAAGKPVELLEAANFNHFEMCESLGNPYGPNGLAALKLMKLA
ncbi:alpha/beta hydrolase [Bradyrhizobium erythrophlei]|jgi:arylformamidase|uniref:Arylformamidase n=1 Tax=Bradyrhizobium erythrophlei TaxID=1437360 RepID=A0A1M7UGJ1_9BRAD|nr:alpha/beta hydrolase [Bradyrhizobium erythrophlei]SHN82123.1 arylformamidase [Bradyrhizobium erythrophlei]